MILATIILAAAATTFSSSPVDSNGNAKVPPGIKVVVDQPNLSKALDDLKSPATYGDNYILLTFDEWTNLLGRVDALEAPMRRRKEAQERNEATRKATVERLKESAKVHALARRNAIEQRQKYLKEKGVKK